MDANATASLRAQTIEKLEGQLRLQSWLGPAFGLAGVLAGVAGLLFVFLREVRQFWPLGVIALVVWGMFAFGRWLVARLGGRLRGAIDLVRRGQPEMLRLVPTMLFGFEGRLFREHGGARAFVFQVPKHGRFGREPERPIALWTQAGDAMLVGNDRGECVLGRQIDRAGFAAFVRGGEALWFWLAAFSLVLLAIPVLLFNLTDRRDLERDRALAVASRQWQRLPAAVVASGVREIRVSRGKSGNVPAWLPDIRYRYTAAGTARDGARRVIFEEPFFERGAAQAIAARYPVGAAIEVAVAPDDPGLAVIEPGHEEALIDKLRAIHYMTLALGATGALVCALLAGLALWQRRLARRLRVELGF